MNSTLPGGYLVLDANGTIDSIPPFLANAMCASVRRELCVYDLFDTAQMPHLSITRVARYDSTLTFHLKLVGKGLQRIFRYWDASTENTIRFYFVDDSALQETHEWEYRKLRTSILGDFENFFSSQIDNRLATIRVLAELMESSPKLKADGAKRLLGKLDELENIIDRVSREVRSSDDSESFVAMDMDEGDLQRVLTAWSNEDVVIEHTISSNISGLDSKVMDRIIYPFVQNAIEANSSDKKVLINIRRIDNAFVQFQISDKGIGMTPHEIKRAEDPFYSTKRGHLGMGIPRAVDRLIKIGGHWDMDSKRNEGTKVSIYIPHPLSEEDEL